MSRYLRETPLAICDRCRLRFPHRELSRDRDNPGLLVCDECNDEKDPWKLPPRKPEDITVRNPRPDVDISVGDNE